MIPLTLREKQSVFARNVARLIEWVYANGYELTLGEAWRPPWVAQENARRGTGIANSIHIDRLAIDINLFKGGAWLDNWQDYQRAGEAWKSLHPLNRWGGDFNMLRDGVHFSMEHEGRA